MPPITKITKEMIIEKGINIVRKNGIESINVRRIANELNCSTQPIMYQYKTMDLLKEDIYKYVDNYHSEYLMNIKGKNNPLLEIGLQYIKFSVEEKNLFKFLFQSDKFSNFDLDSLIYNNDANLKDIFDVIEKQTGVSKEEAKDVLMNLFISVHGLASLYANNSLKYDEKYCISILSKIFNSLFKEEKL